MGQARSRCAPAGRRHAFNSDGSGMGIAGSGAGSVPGGPPAVPQSGPRLPITKKTMARMMPMTNRIHAMFAAVPATPVNPSRPAMMATTRNTTAQLSMVRSPHCSPVQVDRCVVALQHPRLSPHGGPRGHLGTAFDRHNLRCRGLPAVVAACCEDTRDCRHDDQQGMRAPPPDRHTRAGEPGDRGERRPPFRHVLAWCSQRARTGSGAKGGHGYLGRATGDGAVFFTREKKACCVPDPHSATPRCLACRQPAWARGAGCALPASGSAVGNMACFPCRPVTHAT